MTSNAPVHNPDPIVEPPSEVVVIRRGSDRASYELSTVKEILDAGWLANVGTIRDNKPMVTPMFYVRDGDSILIHGAPATGAVKRGRGTDVCITVTHLDGFVLARSALHHSANYRSAVIIGLAHQVEDPEEKEAALELFVDALVPGRMAQLRPTTAKEIRGTSVLRISIAKSSAKIRTGDPVDDEADYSQNIWAGTVPLNSAFGQPIADHKLASNIELPDNVKAMSGFDTDLR